MDMFTGPNKRKYEDIWDSGKVVRKMILLDGSQYSYKAFDLSKVCN